MPDHTSIKDKIEAEVAPKISKYVKQLESEKDEVKQVDLHRKIALVQQKIFIDNIQRLSQKDFDSLMEEVSIPANQNLENYSNNLEQLAYKRLDTPEKFDSFQKIQKIQTELGEQIIDVLNQANMNKRDLERYLTFILLSMGENELKHQTEQLELNEFLSGVGIVANRIGYDHRWLTGLGLIQLHENLIKKKLSELKFKIDKNNKMPFLINELARLIEEKEGRDVKVQLALSQGLKQLRDKLTHAGYKYSISKEDLTLIFDEVIKLEKILYPDENIKIYEEKFENKQNIIRPLQGSGAPNKDGKYLEPEILTVRKGQKITFANTDNAAHTFTSGTANEGPDGIFHTSLLMTGGSFEWIPTKTGEYPYHCMVHPWKQGKIIVID